MPLKVTEIGHTLYAIREKRHGKLETRYFEYEYQAINYRAKMAEKKLDLLKLIEQEKELNRKLAQLEKIVIEITNQTMMVLGFVRRRGIYVLTKHLRTPLSKEEKNLIRRTKANAVQFSFNSLLPKSQKTVTRFNSLPSTPHTSQAFRLLNQFRPSVTNLLPKAWEGGAPVKPPISGLHDWRDGRDGHYEFPQTHDSQPNDPKSQMTVTRFNSLPSEPEIPMTPEHEARLIELNSMALIPETQDEVREILWADKDNYKLFGEVSTWAQQAVLTKMRSNSVRYISAVEGIVQLREQLLEEGDSAAERLAVELVITNHLQVADSAIHLEAVKPGEATTVEAKHWAHVHNQAQIRLMRSMNHLTKIRSSKINTALLLYKNRPNQYDRSDYLERSAEEINTRQREVVNARMKAHDDEIQARQNAEQEARQSQKEEERSQARMAPENRQVKQLILDNKNKQNLKVTAKAENVSNPKFFTTPQLPIDERPGYHLADA